MDQKYSCKGEIVVTVRTGSGLGGGSWSQMRTSHLRAAAGRAGPDWAGPGQAGPDRAGPEEVRPVQVKVRSVGPPPSCEIRPASKEGAGLL